MTEQQVLELRRQLGIPDDGPPPEWKERPGRKPKKDKEEDE